MIKSINNLQLLPIVGDRRLAIVGGIGVAMLVTVVLPLIVSIKLELRSIGRYRTTTLAPGNMADDGKAQREKRTASAPDEPSERRASDVF